MRVTLGKRAIGSCWAKGRSDDKILTNHGSPRDHYEWIAISNGWDTNPGNWVDAITNGSRPSNWPKPVALVHSGAFLALGAFLAQAIHRLDSTRLGLGRRLGSASLGPAPLGLTQLGSAWLGSAQLGSALLGLGRRVGSAWLCHLGSFSAQDHFKQPFLNGLTPPQTAWCL